MKQLINYSNNFNVSKKRLSYFSFFLILFTLSIQTAWSQDLKVMKQGLGSGTIATTAGSSGINCGGDCDETYVSGTVVNLLATPTAGSVFVGWEGDASGASTTTSVTMNSDKSVRARFGLSIAIPLISTTPINSNDFTPEAIQAYLTANLSVNTPARFISALPVEFKQNWILMSRSESLQTGTAEFPRILLPSADAKFVFSIGISTDASYPGSHPNAIEYMQWDATEKNFRFHEIVLAPIPVMGAVPARIREVSIDDDKCSKCHSTRNVLNRSSFNGTTGIPPNVPPNEVVKSKNKPNWDAYDSWAGMLPFNRDRIYQGSVEAAAFRNIFNLWNWRGSDKNDGIRQLINQLQLQPSYLANTSPHRIVRNINNTSDIGHIAFGFDGLSPIATTSNSNNYDFDGTNSTSTNVNQGGRYVTLRHSNPMPVPGTSNDSYTAPSSDEGRGVQLFDLLNGLDGNLNQLRIVDELINHRFATGSVPIDIRPITLAITKSNFSGNGPLRINAVTNEIESNVSGTPLTVDLNFFNLRGMSINNLITDTDNRSKNLPLRKVDIQKINLDRAIDDYTNSATNGLIQQYGSVTTQGTNTSTSRIRQDVFRRPQEIFPVDNTIMGGIYIDRELYSLNTKRIATYRYFLEPLGVSVDKWSMGVRGRSREYNFADIFSRYIPVFQTELTNSLTSEPIPGLANPNDNAQLITAINSTLSGLPGINDVPKFTGIQRIFNKACIECHGGLDYPPYANFGNFLDFSEDENPPAGDERLSRSHSRALSFTTTNPLTSIIYQRITATASAINHMPFKSPSLTNADIETIRRWIVGPPSRPYTHGDPHIRTVDGISYDFQDVGEFVLLRGQDFEIQTRHTEVATNSPLGPNAHTGLTSCVSVNGAVALKIGKNRITYQPNLSGKPDPEGMQLRVDGELVRLNSRGMALSSGGRIIQTNAQGGIQIEIPGGTVIVITPGWWDYYKVWFLNIDTRHIRATEGLMGIVPPKSWLPALPDGSSMGSKPKTLNERHRDLYDVFGNAWRVNDSISLFDYAPGTSTETFTHDWATFDSQTCKFPFGEDKPPLQPITLQVATQSCADIVDPERRANCIKDVMITGEITFAETYLAADKIDRNKYPDFPVLTFPENFQEEVTLPVNFTWNNANDEDQDRLNYKIYVWHVNEQPNTNNAVSISTETSFFVGNSLFCKLLFIFIILLLIILVYFLIKRKTKLLILLIAIVLIVLIALYYNYCYSASSNKKLSHTVTELESGKDYFWKVIVEDDNGGTTESETRRFKVK